MIGEGSIGRVHLGRWQETDVAIKVLGRVMHPASLPTAAAMQSTGQMSALEEGESSEESSEDEYLLNEDMALTVKTLEREVCSTTRHQHCIKTLAAWCSLCVNARCSLMIEPQMHAAMHRVDL